MTDPANPRDLAPAAPRTDGAKNFGVNPVLPLAAAGASGESVQLWDISKRARPTLLGTLAESGTEDQAVAFSPDGALLAAPTPAARALVEALLPAPTVRRTRDPLLRELHDEGAAETPDGLLRVDAADGRVLDRAGRPHPRRFALGPFTDGRTPGGVRQTSQSSPRPVPWTVANRTSRRSRGSGSRRSRPAHQRRTILTRRSAGMRPSQPAPSAPDRSTPAAPTRTMTTSAPTAATPAGSAIHHDPNTAPTAVSNGADTLVAGNAIFGAANPLEAAAQLREAAEAIASTR